MAQKKLRIDRLQSHEMQRNYRVLRLGLIVTSVLLLITTLALFLTWRTNSEHQSRAATAIVKRGDLQIIIQGKGVLAPISQGWILATAAGTVEEVFVRTGDRVEKGAKIVSLVKPSLYEDVRRIELALAEARADHRSLLANAADRRLTGQARIVDADFALKGIKLRLDAETELLRENVISRIKFQQTQIASELSKAVLDIEKKRLDQIEQKIDGEIEASATRVGRAELATQRAQNSIRGLTVYTKIGGIVREVMIEAGQQVDRGAGVAKIANIESLIGVVQIPEAQASLLAIGQLATTMLSNESVSGVVTRVDPAVISRNVEVDIKFDSMLPDGVRPNLSIQATITVADLNDVLYVERPINAIDDSTTEVTRVSQDRTVANRVVVVFGVGTPNEIQVLDGLSEGDIIVTDGSTRWLAEESFASK